MNMYLRAMDIYAGVLGVITVVLGALGLGMNSGMLLAIAGITLTVTLVTYPLRWAAGAISDALSRRTVRE